MEGRFGSTRLTLIVARQRARTRTQGSPAYRDGAKAGALPSAERADKLRLRGAVLDRSQQIRDLAASRWIANGENVLLLGPPGVGKSHLAVALGREAIMAGYTLQFSTAVALVAMLVKAHSE
jgi:DNA replication protein DnaC